MIPEAALLAAFAEFAVGSLVLVPLAAGRQRRPPTDSTTRDGRP